MTICIPSDTDWACYGTDEQVAALNPIMRRRAEILAWTTLRSLLGNRLSLCPTEIRPCAVGCSRGTYFSAPVGSGGSFSPLLSNGVWTNGCGCQVSDSCSCSSVSQVTLPGTVGDVESVRIDGVALPQSAYRVDNGNKLVRQDGELWPICQDMSRPADEEGTFVVSYWIGLAPDELTRMAAGMLAAEFYKACTGDSKCKLPKGVRQITRQGVQMQINADQFDGGFTGLEGVDSVIRIYNPHVIKQEAVVMVPRPLGGSRQTTWRR